MNFLLFTIWTLGRGFNAVYTKKAQKMTDNTYGNSIKFVFYYALFQLIILLCIPPYKHIPIRLDFIIYPVLFGVFYIISYIMLFMALGNGPTALTNVVYTFHTIIPMISGILLWNESISKIQAVGIVLAAISVYLFYKSVKKENEKELSLKWLIYVIIATVAIGIAVVFTQSFAKMYPDMNKQYLTIYTITSAVLSLIFLLTSKKTKDVGKNKPEYFKYFIYILIASICQNIVNIVFMYFINLIPSTVLFPTINCIYILTFIVMGRIFFKEKLNKLSFIGVCSSIFSLILLNL